MTKSKTDEATELIRRDPKSAQEVSDAIRDLVGAIDTRARSMNQLGEQIIQIKSAALVKVSEAMQPGGTKPLYTNDKARDAAMKIELDTDDTFQAISARQRAFQLEQVFDTAQLDWLRRQFQIALIDYEAARLGRRDAQ